MPVKFRGMDLVSPVNRLMAGFCNIVSNCRAYILGGFMLRNPLSNPIEVPESEDASVDSGTVSQSGSGAAWSNPSNLYGQGSFTTVTINPSGTNVSSVSSGSSIGGGAPWTNPGNIDSTSSYASVSLSAGGGYNYTPSDYEGGAEVTATFSNPNPSGETTDLSGMPSVAATSATLYVTIYGTITMDGSGSATLRLNYSDDSGSIWQSAGFWTASFTSTTIPIAIAGISNLDTLQIQIIATANLTSGDAINSQVVVTNWYATVSGAAQPKSQTLSAAISGLTIPAGATITGLGISFQAEYSGANPSFMVSLNVGTMVDSPTLTTSPVTYQGGGNGILWGYSTWTSATLSSLVTNFIASTNGNTIVQVNSLTITVYYSESSQILSATNLGLSISTSATVTGIGITFQGQSSSTNAISLSIYALQDGTSVGSPLFQAIATGPSAYTIGGNNYLWGTVWTPALINGSTGIGFSFQAIGSGNSIVTTGISALTVTVFYTEPASLILPAPPHTIQRLNDSTPAGPASGYTFLVGAGTSLYNGLDEVGTGFSGNPLSIIPFRPNASVQPWGYVGDNSQAVTLSTTSLYSGSPVQFPCTGMVKVRSDGLAYKMGVKEPQSAPLVGTESTTVTIVGVLEATAIPWTNYEGANSDYNYGETNGYPNPVSPDGTAPFVIDCENATSITFSITGTATINGASSAPTTPGPSTAVSTNPGHYAQDEGTGVQPPSSGTCSVVVCSFTDGSGNVVGVGQAPSFVSSVVDVGGNLGNAILIPYNAVACQVGINSTGNTFSDNSGTFSITVTVTTDALPPNTATIGNLTIDYYGDSPVSGPVGTYIWKNPGDSSGSGPTRTASSAVGSTSGNSFIFDANFGTSAVPSLDAGIPGPPGLSMYTTNQGDTIVPMAWTQLSPQSVAIGTESVFQPAIKGVDGNTAYQNFNFCLTGTIYIPQAGEYTFVLTYKDDVIWGISGATVISATGSKLQYASGNPPTLSSTTSESTSLSDAGQTITVISGIPLLPRVTVGYSNHGEGGVESQATVVVSFASSGTYPIEIDYDFWYYSGRILLLQASPTPGADATIIPPLPANVREDVQYRYTYRSSATGATSNPSPESTPISLPVTASTVTSLWSSDPQVDVVDYYRLDSVVASFTYVATGPNDNSGGGTNTSIVDSLTDLELGTQLLSYDNYEPFPSIDLPQKGVCSVSGGVITWLSGGAIGGSSVGFNTRWLAGTTILIGSPTSLAYVLIARPTSPTSMTIPDVPDGTNLTYEIPEPVLAAQPLPYIWGPTDNINFSYGVGDPLRPGTLYWCEGENLDSAPDTNQLDVTDPGEPLVNGAMSGGLGALFSISRAWVIMPNFFNALATVTGTQGSTWTLQATSITRGLYIPRCLVVEGSGNIFFRVEDGIHVSPGGLASKSITDETLYPLFSHEGSTPVPVTRNGITIYPPDDTLPQLQKFSNQSQWIYYDYQGTDGQRHTLVFDIIAMAWMWDLYDVPATVHASNAGLGVQGILVGCSDGSVRQLESGGSETVMGTVLSPAIGGKGFQHVGQIQCEYSAQTEITMTGIAMDSNNGSYGFPSVTLPSTGGQITKYFFRPGPNKWKLLSLQFQFTDPDAQVNIEGIVCWTRSWGDSGPYVPTQPFASTGGLG